MAEEKEVLLTKEGLAKLEAELEYLKSFRRQEVAERFKQALAPLAISRRTPNMKMLKTNRLLLREGF